MPGGGVNVIFTAAAGGGGFVAAASLAGGYDPGDMIEIDRAIRHMPIVVNHLVAKANECKDLIEKSDDFRVILSTGGESRARAYVAPANGGGIHLELADSVLLKAAVAMDGR
jgi:hypothetical protein